MSFQWIIKAMRREIKTQPDSLLRPARLHSANSDFFCLNVFIFFAILFFGFWLFMHICLGLITATEESVLLFKHASCIFMTESSLCYRPSASIWLKSRESTVNTDAEFTQRSCCSKIAKITKLWDSPIKIFSHSSRKLVAAIISNVFCTQSAGIQAPSESFFISSHLSRLLCTTWE